MQKVTAAERVFNCLCKQIHFSGAATQEDVRILKDMLMQKVDYSQNKRVWMCILSDGNIIGSDITQVVKEWKELILERRQELNQPPLPINLGLCDAFSLTAVNGTAHCCQKLIDDDGCFLVSNPWEDYYLNSTPDLLNRAKHLHPVLPEYYDAKIMNRRLCQNLTLEEDGLALARSDNAGVLTFLINQSNADFSSEFVFEIAKKAVSMGQWSVCITLLDKGMPLYPKDYEGAFSCLPFIELIRSTTGKGYLIPGHYHSPVILCKHSSEVHQKFLKALATAVVDNLCESYFIHSSMGCLAQYFNWTLEQEISFWIMCEKKYVQYANAGYARGDVENIHKELLLKIK